MSSRISLCIIAKNEATLIGQCIKSVQKFVDQIVVVDTGSTDQTKDIAQHLGAEVWDFIWTDDFSAARNYSLEKAQGDWILFMDCDEALQEDSGTQLQTAIKSAWFDAYYINIINILPTGNSMTFKSIRLFRNLPVLRFQGKIHEQISQAIIQHSGQHKIGHIPVTLLHYGYNPEKVNIKAKINRNVQLLEKQKNATKSQDGFLLYNLGVEHLRKGDFQKALEHFIQSLKNTNSNVGYASPLAHKTIACLIAQKRFRDALEQLANFQKIFPNYSDLFLLEAACHLQCGRFTLAQKAIKQALQLTNTAPTLNYPLEGTIFGQNPQTILETIQPITVQKQKKFSLTVCIIANNAEKNIANCLKSISEVADEVLLITTNCTDNTLNIAYQMDAHIYRVQWDNSFAKLRNFAKEQAIGDWILFMNDNQQLAQADLSKLVKHLNTSTALAYYLKLTTFCLEQEQSLQAPYDQAVCQLIRNKMDIYYNSRILEDVDESIKKHHSEEAIKYLPLNISEWETKEETTWKTNLTLLAQDLKTQGKNTLIYEAFGLEYLKLPNYKLALKNFQQARKLAPKVSPTTLLGITTCLYHLEEYAQAIKIAKLAHSQFPDYTDIYYLQGCCYLELGYLSKATQCFSDCFKSGTPSWQKYLVQPALTTYLAHYQLATVHLKENNWDKALHQYQLAARYPQGIPLAIPALTNLLVEHFDPQLVLKFFRENNLTAYEHLHFAAQTLLQTDHPTEGLQLLEATHQKIITENRPNLYQNFASLMFDYLRKHSFFGS